VAAVIYSRVKHSSLLRQERRRAMHDKERSPARARPLLTEADIAAAGGAHITNLNERITLLEDENERLREELRRLNGREDGDALVDKQILTLTQQNSRLAVALELLQHRQPQVCLRCDGQRVVNDEKQKVCPGGYLLKAACPACDGLGATWVLTQETTEHGFLEAATPTPVPASNGVVFDTINEYVVVRDKKTGSYILNPCSDGAVQDYATNDLTMAYRWDIGDIVTEELENNEEIIRVRVSKVFTVLR